MNKASLLGAALAAATLPSAAMAVTPIDGNFTVSDLYNPSNSDNGLAIAVNPPNGHFTIADIDSPATINLFNISTPEGSIEGDDLNPHTIKVDFSFLNPAGATGSGVTGSTVGEKSLLGFYQDGKVTWDGPTVFDFGNGGQFSVSLSDAIFNSGAFWGLGNKGAKIKATFALISPSAVPEAGTWAMMILGIGFVGVALRRRQQPNVTYA
jgi:hypothetical protein